jgi:hypothetical protein
MPIGKTQGWKALQNDTSNFVTLIEPPDADPHVRWCERGRLVTAPYSISILVVILVPVGNDLDRRPDETVCFPELVFHVAHVGKMEQFWIVDMKDKSGRIHPYLGPIIDFQLASGV